MNSAATKTAINRIVERLASRKGVGGVAFQICSPLHDYASSHHHGSLAHHDRPYYVASINKMMITAMAIVHFKDAPKLSSLRVRDFFSDGFLGGLLADEVLERLTLWHLVTNSSGLPCYLLDSEKGGRPLMKQFLDGYDEQLPFDSMLSRVGKLSQKFLPGQPGKAYYANTNFRILARILEIESGRDIRQLLTDFMSEANMDNSFVISEGMQQDLLPLTMGSKTVLPLKFLASTGYDIYSTAGDQMIFLRGFFSGAYFDVSNLPALYQWRKVFFPMQYGGGLQRFSVPRILSPFHAPTVLIGHAGSTGAWAFYAPDRDLYLTGCIDQARAVPSAFRTMLHIASKFPRKGRE